MRTIEAVKLTVGQQYVSAMTPQFNLTQGFFFKNRREQFSKVVTDSVALVELGRSFHQQRTVTVKV